MCNRHSLWGFSSLPCLTPSICVAVFHMEQGSRSRHRLTLFFFFKLETITFEISKHLLFKVEIVLGGKSSFA